MGLEPFTQDDQIFRDEDVLRDNYRPDDLIERDKELSEYQAALKPVIKGARPRNIFVYGQTGVGKSLATAMIMNRLLLDQENYPDIDIEVVELTCKSLTSSYQVTAHLVNQFRSQDEQITPTGYTPGMINDMLWRHLNELEATHCLIVLDEVDSIGKDDDILYELPRCNDNGNVEDTKIGVVGISNDFTFRDNLSGRVKDSLCDEEIHFPPYDADQLSNILMQRAEKAFTDGVLEDDVIPLSAAHAAQDSGSARQALKLLFKAGDLAREREAPSVTEQHVREAEKLIEEGKVKDELESLPTQSHLTLLAILMLSKGDAIPAKTRVVYEKYVELAELANADVKTDRTIRDRLSQLTLKGFLGVEEQNDGIHGGSYHQYTLEVRTDIVEDALQSQTRINEVFH